MTAEGAELLGSLQTSWSWLVRVGLSDEAEEFAKPEIREVAMVSHNPQQRGAAEAGGVKFAVEQRMGAAVMLLQEVLNWAGGQSVLSGHELYKDNDLDTVFAIPRNFACDVRENAISKRYTCRSVGHCVGMFRKMTCGG